MKRFHLQPLIDLATDKSQAAAQELARFKQVWQDAENKLAQLKIFLDEYNQTLQQQSQIGFSISQLRDFQAFILKLELAIRAQSEEVERCRQRWVIAQEEWQAREREVKAYETLRRRHDDAERRTEERLDQRLQDEFARNLHRRRTDSQES
jgi:flagellar FliJ protein